ncbi:MAG TPA: nuclear transport factor 2 family protein [Nocardioidaceae bacterium]
MENSKASTPAEKSAAVDELMVDDVRGWLNGASRGDRHAERESEAFLFAALPDYRRDVDHVLIDPPHAAVTWRMRGTVADGQPLPAGTQFELTGASVWRFDDDGLIEEFWMYFHDPLAGSDGPE